MLSKSLSYLVLKFNLAAIGMSSDAGFPSRSSLQRRDGIPNLSSDVIQGKRRDRQGEGAYKGMKSESSAVSEGEGVTRKRRRTTFTVPTWLFVPSLPA
ncbi:hypothetical protein NPIL_36751 [Nephila pilipes]|uniref:Uncharacterized protein n=1 Tax=Nephila pilipes TaxID=299642 RepID=A0A8X6TPL7_NEPPI|nr:hypothetical protein NPIL_36751 [Nephila pilipes]